MSDLAVTVPPLRWSDWIAAGDPAGDPDSGKEYAIAIGMARPDIRIGERVYIVSHGLVRGYALLTGLRQRPDDGRWLLLRRGGAVAVTIDEEIKDFKGARCRWWDPTTERPFPEWRTEGVKVIRSKPAKPKAAPAPLPGQPSLFGGGS